MNRSLGRVAVLGGSLLLTACQPPPDPPPTLAQCGGEYGPPMALFSLFFGRSIPARGDVTERQWAEFLDRVITANLPNGYTVHDATGAWMNPATQRTIREPTKVLIVALPDVPDSMMAISRIRNAYQVQFRQHRVGMTVRQACGSF